MAVTDHSGNYVRKSEPVWFLWIRDEWSGYDEYGQVNLVKRVHSGMKPANVIWYMYALDEVRGDSWEMRVSP
jgi:hypothetical protein